MHGFFIVYYFGNTAAAVSVDYQANQYPFVFIDHLSLLFTGRCTLSEKADKIPGNNMIIIHDTRNISFDIDPHARFVVWSFHPTAVRQVLLSSIVQ